MLNNWTHNIDKFIINVENINKEKLSLTQCIFSDNSQLHLPLYTSAADNTILSVSNINDNKITLKWSDVNDLDIIKYLNDSINILKKNYSDLQAENNSLISKLNSVNGVVLQIYTQLKQLNHLNQLNGLNQIKLFEDYTFLNNTDSFNNTLKQFDTYLSNNVLIDI